MKRIVCFLMSVALVFSFVPSTVFANEEVGKVVVFEDDLSLGEFYWKCENGAYVNDGKIITSVGFNIVRLLNNEVVFGDCVAEFDFVLTGRSKNEGEFFMMNFADTSIFVRPGKGTFVQIKGQGESKVSDFSDLEIGKTYQVRLTAKGRGVSFEIKEKDAAFFTMVGVVAKKDTSLGDLTFASYYPSAIDNIKITSDPGKDNFVSEKVMNIPVGSSKKIKIDNATGEFTYKSKDETIALVGEDGTVTAMKKGYTAVDILDSSENVVQNVGIKVFNPIQLLRITSMDNKHTYYEGDVFSFGVATEPSNADLTVEWIVEGDAVEKLSASMKNNTYRAVKPGQAAVVVRDVTNPVMEKKYDLTILPETDRPKDTTENIALGWTGESQKIVAQMGMHLTPAVQANENGIWADTLRESLPVGTVRNEQSITITSLLGGTTFEERFEDMKTKFPLYEIGNALDIPVYTVIYPLGSNEVAGSDDTDFMKVLDLAHSQNKSNQPLHIELGNETYAIDSERAFPRAADYFKWAADMSKKIKDKYPDTKTYAVLLANTMESNILSDAVHKDSLEDDWAYTQAHRAVEWNEESIKWKESFDGFTVHDYQSSENVDGLTAEDYIEDTFAYANQHYYGILNLYDRIGKDSPFALTEWGQLNGDVFWAGGYDVSAKARHQRGKYAISALGNMEMFLNQVKSGVVEASHYHALADSQGFGVWEGNNAEDTLMTCNYHVFKQLSDLLYVDNLSYYYDIQGISSGYDIDRRPFYWGTDENVIIEDVAAWGFGDESGIKKIVMVNHTDASQNVSVNGVQIKPIWSYGGDKDTIAPSWSVNEAYKSFSDRLYTLSNAEELLPTPNMHEGASFVETVQIPKYTAMVVEISGTPEKIEGHVGPQLSKITEYRMNNALALKIGNNIAINDNIKTPIDKDNASIVPVVKDGRTLLPLRFVAESFGCDVEFDDATSVITITGEGINVQMTLGKKEYIVNGETKTLDVPAEATEGRTLVPLRALAEAIGKDVLWDTRGLVIVTNSKTAFLDYNEEKDVIDLGCVDETKSHIDEILALFN